MTVEGLPCRPIRILLAILLIGACNVASPALERTGFDEASALRSSQSALGRTLGHYTLTTTDGRPLNLATLRGKPLLVSFIYTGCFQVCPVTTRKLKLAVESAQRAIGNDSFNVISIGFNVPFDTPQAMGAFMRKLGGAPANWYFLSTDQATLEALSRDLGFSFQGAAAGFEHITQISVIDQSGKVFRQIYGDAFPLPQLVNPLKELVTGTPHADESLTQLVERVRILCTVYDPVTGSYRYKYSILLEIAGGLFSICAVGVFVLRELRRHRLPRASIKM